MLSDECQTEWDDYHAQGTALGDAYNKQVLQFFTSTTINNPLDDERCLYKIGSDGVVLVNSIECDASTSLMDEDMEYRNACENSVGGQLRTEDVFRVSCNMLSTEAGSTTQQHGVFTMIYPRYYRCYPPPPEIDLGGTVTTEGCTIKEIVEEFEYNVQMRLLSFEGETIRDSTQTDTAFLHGCAVGEKPLPITLSPTSAPVPVPTTAPLVPTPVPAPTEPPIPNHPAWSRPIGPPTKRPTYFDNAPPAYAPTTIKDDTFTDNLSDFMNESSDSYDDDNRFGFSGFFILWLCVALAFLVRHMRLKHINEQQQQQQGQSASNNRTTTASGAGTSIAPDPPIHNQQVFSPVVEELDPTVQKEITKPSY